LPVPEYGSGRFSLQAWDFLAPDKHASGKMKKMNEIFGRLNTGQIFMTVALKEPNMNNPWRSQG